MQNRIWIGNDVVDLEDPAALGKATNPRFLAKICAPEEIDFVLNSPNPHVTLWTLWAMKEACYKVAQKAEITQVFNPKLFKCKFLPSYEASYGEKTFAVRVNLTPSHVHAVALNEAAWNCVSQRLVESTSDPSEAVRELALSLVEERGLKGCTIGPLSPPHVLQKGKRVEECDISLSHDGRFIAAAVFYKTP